MNKFHKETNEAHDSKANSCSHGDFLELFAVRLGATFEEPHRILSELLSRSHYGHNLIHGAGTKKVFKLGNKVYIKGNRCNSR